MVIPLGDHNPVRSVPVVTWLLLCTNVVVFVALTPWWAGGCEQLAFYARWAAVPAELVRGTVLPAARLGEGLGAHCALPPTGEKRVYLSVLTAMFLHGGWAHLLFNMLYLAIFGNNVEDRLGHLRFLLFYVGTGVVATVAFVAANAASTSTLVGASGAIAGVLGAYLVLFPRARVTVLVPFLLFLVTRLSAVFVLGLWFVLQLQSLRIGSLAGGQVAYLAHVAGFIAGALLIVPLTRRRRTRRRRPQLG